MDRGFRTSRQRIKSISFRIIKYMTVWFLFFSLFQPVCNASNKPDAALNPNPATYGFTNTENKLIINELRSALSRYYRLISDRQYEKGFQEFQDNIEYEEDCSSESCIQFLQDVFQINRIFALMVIRQGRLTQLTLNLARLEDSLTSTERCDKCDVSMLLERIKPLVEKIKIQDLGRSKNREPIITQGYGRDQKSRPITKLDLRQEQTPINQLPPAKKIEQPDWPWWYWVVGAVVVGAFGAVLSGSGSNSGSGSSTSSSCPAGDGNCGSTTITW